MAASETRDIAIRTEKAVELLTTTVVNGFDYLKKCIDGNNGNPGLKSSVITLQNDVAELKEKDKGRVVDEKELAKEKRARFWVIFALCANMIFSIIAILKEVW